MNDNFSCLMPLSSKWNGVPLREPGTHTNDEVKEALHARAQRRTIVITLTACLLFGCLGVISNIAQQYEDPEDTTSSPKAIVIVASELTVSMMEVAKVSNNLPFNKVLSLRGAVNAQLRSNYTSKSSVAGTNQTNGGVEVDIDSAGSDHTQAVDNAIVRLLVGSSTSSRVDLDGQRSFLRVLTENGFKPVVLAPWRYWSSNSNASSQSEHSTVGEQCAQVGLFDTECSGQLCPPQNSSAYCNAQTKLISCNLLAQLERGDIIEAFTRTLNEDADMLYVQLDSFCRAARVNLTEVGDELMQLSLINTLDSVIGQIALVLSERTKNIKENWLIVVTGDGANSENKAPFFEVAYSRGDLVQLGTVRPDAETADVYDTVLRWFALTGEATSALGICSDGVHVVNCNNTNASS